MSGRLMRWLLSLTHRPTISDGPRVTIIRHHRVFLGGSDPLYRLGVSLDVFERQLMLLDRLGLQPLTVSEALDRARAGEPGHWVALSFDDGYADNVEAALPAMQRYGARGTFFLASDWMTARTAPWWDVVAHALQASAAHTSSWTVDGVTHTLQTEDVGARLRTLRAILPTFRKPLDERAAVMDSLRRALGVEEPTPCELATWQQAELLRDAGMEIGAHTRNHPHLSLLDADQQRSEISGSLTGVREHLGVECRGLAYPEGDYDDTTLAVAAELGLEWAVTTRSGDNDPDAPQYELRRRGLSEGACLAPGRRFSDRLAMAELLGAFDDLRGLEVAS